MKTGILLNSEVSYIIAKMGHKDSLTIGDAGLPIPEGTARIDLAVTKGVPGVLQVLAGILSEQQVERAILAEEIKSASPELHKKILALLRAAEEGAGRAIELVYLPHEEFKRKTKESRAVVRTGEFTPYANIILVSGVVF